MGFSEVDLHLHTTASDGRLTPRQLVQFLARSGVKYAAITDHDTTEGLAEALDEAKRFPGLTVVPGIELSCEGPGREAHLLGLFIDHEDPELQRDLKRLRDGREDRAQRMVEKLGELGFPVTWESVQRIAGDASIGRPHIALALIERGYVTTTNEAFDRFLGNNGPAHVDREKITPEEAVRKVLRHKGVPVLAHPTFSGSLDDLLPAMCSAGLLGMEVFYKGYLPDTVGWLLSLAQRHGLLPCGGSDFHGLPGHGEVDPGTVGPPVGVFKRLERLAADLRARATSPAAATP
ncbi:MAG: PHP domain-containing protein [SAR202 cluster bacterium]|nr:PHP domain-containing protein [SAR202 cluster bacterium]